MILKYQFYELKAKEMLIKELKKQELDILREKQKERAKQLRMQNKLTQLKVPKECQVPLFCRSNIVLTHHSH